MGGLVRFDLALRLTDLGWLGWSLLRCLGAERCDEVDYTLICCKMSELRPALPLFEAFLASTLLMLRVLHGEPKCLFTLQGKH